MDYLEMISETRKNFAKKQFSFTKEEQKYNTGKDTFRGKILGFMTSAYYKRGKLFSNGKIIYCLAFKEWTNRFEDDRPVATWVLFSPAAEFDANPEILLKIKSNLDSFVAKGKPSRELHNLYVALTGELSEPSYMEIPSEFSEGHLVYLSALYLRKNQVPVFHLGMNLIIADRSISKEVVYLPTIYWAPLFEKFYTNRD